MREFAFELLSEISGLRPSPRATRRSPFLVEAKNIRVGEFGLEAYVPVISPWPNPLTTFPWPQVIEEDRLLLGHVENPEVIGIIDDSVVPWDRSYVPAYDALDLDVEKTIVTAGQWHVASFPGSFYLFNGEAVLFKTPLVPNKILLQDEVKIRTGCTHRGRVVFGGFVPGNIWNTDWKAIFSEISDEMPMPDIGENWVMWSSIGGGDFPLWLFWPDVIGGHAPTAERFIERAKRNEFGFMPMRWRGQVQCVKPLQGNVVVYGEGGVSALVPTERVHDMAPTYGLQEVVSVGIPQRDCVGGDESGHIFIDDSGALWSLGGNLQATRLGFEEYFFPMLGGPIRISFDSQRREFRICSDEAGYLLTTRGLTEIHQRVASSFYFQGGVVGTFENDVDEEGLIVTAQLDMSTASIKTITAVSVDYRSSEDVFVAIDYKYHRNDEWQRSKWVIVNREGNARVNVSGLEFRIAVRTLHYLDFEVDRLQIRWQKSDKRITRGPDADPSVTGASE